MWWPPTRDKRKTDYGGAYWPAKVTERLANGLRVEYDNGDIEVVEAEHLSPATVPVGFGEEHPRLQVCECVVWSPRQPRVASLRVCVTDEILWRTSCVVF